MINEDESDKTCYGDHFKCDECTLYEGKGSEWKQACKKQCEYNWEHRNEHSSVNHCDDDYDIPGQYATSYDSK